MSVVDSATHSQKDGVEGNEGSFEDGLLNFLFHSSIHALTVPLLQNE